MNSFKSLCLLGVICSSFLLKAQSPLYFNVPVNDVGANNNIGNANTSRNLAFDNEGNIYVVFTGDAGIRVARSINRGQSFSPSVLVTSYNSDPEIIVNHQDVIFISWVQSGNIMLSRSTDRGVSFSLPVAVGVGNVSVHMAVFENNIYLTDKFGEFVYFNFNSGLGAFNSTQLSRKVFADICVDQNGVVYAPSDNPIISLYKSFDEGISFSSILLKPAILTLFSSYALSDGPCGTYVFVGGNGSVGYKIDVSNGNTFSLDLGNNIFNNGARTLFADHRGTLIDGYQNNSGELVMKISNDQGQSFGEPIVIAEGGSHNIARNHITEDIVVVYEQNGDIFVSVYENLLKSIKIESPVPLEACFGSIFTIPYELSTGFGTNTQLDFYISDVSGSFENKTLIASTVTNESGSIDIILPDSLLPSDGYRLQIESAADCTQSNVVDVEIYYLPNVSISGDISPICEGMDAIFRLKGTPHAEVNYSINESNTNLVTLDALGHASITSFSVTSDQSLNLESAVNPLTGCSNPLNDTAVVRVNPIPIVNLEDNYLLCVNTNGTETVISPPVIDTFLNSIDYHFEWYLGGEVISAFSGSPAIIPTSGGDYVVEVVNLLTGCTTISNIAMVNESSPPIITSKVVTLAFAKNHVINVEAVNSASFNAISEYEFSLNNNSWVSGRGYPGGVYTFTFEQDVKLGVNIIRARDIKGCGEFEIEVIVMDYPHFFTPNGDGYHNTWNIAGMRNQSEARIYIFDRYGKLLKQLVPNGSGWDGTYKGAEMPTSDYWFTVTFIEPKDGTLREFKSHFTLIR